MKKKTIATILLLIAFASLRSQDSYYFRHYQVENGLSHNTVMCSIQDDKGFMWLGTKDGLNRFDGNAFKVFRHDEDDSTAIGNDYIRYLHLNKGGELFVGTQQGIYQYHPRTENFTHIISSGKKSIKEITTDAQGNLWYIAQGALTQLGKKDGKARVYEVGKYFWATSMCTTNDGNFWIATADGQLKKYNPASDTFTSYAIFDGPVNNKWIEKLYAGGQGTIFLGTAGHGLLSFDIVSAKTKNIISKNKDGTGIFVRDILQTKNGEYWLATESGIFIYTAATSAIVNLKKDYHNPYALSDNAVYTLCKDKEGGLWAGTFFGGMNYYVEQHAIFQKNFPDNNKASLSGNAVREIVKDKYGNLWIGTEDAGLNKIDASGAISHFMPDGTRNSIAYYNIHGLLAVQNELWVGTFEHGLDVLDIKTGKVIRHYEAGNGSNDLKSNFIFSIYKTDKGQILVGTTAGVFLYQAATDDFSPVPQLGGYTYNILEDSKGIWWTATISEGIKFLDPRTGKSGNYQYNKNDKAGITNNMVNSLFEDNKGNLWIATEGGGVCCLTADRNSIKRYTSKNGLPSNFVFKVLQDEANQIWITTSKGLVKLNSETDDMTVYTSANGLLNDQFNYNSGFKDASGRLYFGSVKGLISFNPASFRTNAFIPPIYFTGFQVHNTELPIGKEGALSQSILYTKVVELPHDQSSFSIDFAALSYTAPQMNTYAYKMDGIDSKWMRLEKNRKVYFTNLAPGDYVFKVKAANGSGVWNEKEISLSITILPPWWKSVTAYIIYSLLALSMAFLLFRNYHGRMKRKAQQKLDMLQLEKEKEIYEAKMQFFTNIAHEIRTPLTLIKGPLERVIKKAEDIPEIKNSLAIMERNTDRLIDLTNQLLDYRQTEAGGFTLNFTEENVSALLEETYVNFKPLAEQKNLAYTLHLPNQALIAFADAEALIKMISNLLSNAIKYAETKVFITLSLDKANSFTIELRNDGTLIPPEMQEKVFEPFFRLKKNEKQKGTGIGLALARSLAQLHGGTLYIKDDEHLNIFVLTLPVHQERQVHIDKSLASLNTLQEINP